MKDFEDALKAIGSGLLSLFAIVVAFALLSAIDFGIGFNPFASALSIIVGGIVLALIVVFVILIIKIIQEFTNSEGNFI